jgi:hypothetical protein
MKSAANFSFNPELQMDLLKLQSRPVHMEDRTVEGILNDVGMVLEKVNEAHTHIMCVYDLRSFVLPGPSGAMARTKQLVKWCDSCEHLIDKHIMSVVVIMNKGFATKLLKSCVDFVIWACDPPMDPRVFYTEEETMQFLKERRQKYVDCKLMCKPSTPTACYRNPPTADDLKTTGCTCHKSNSWKGPCPAAESTRKKKYESPSDPNERFESHIPKAENGPSSARRSQSA